jgi:hypothetical protein
LQMSRSPRQLVSGLQNLLVGELVSCPSGPGDIDEQTTKVSHMQAMLSKTEIFCEVAML